MRIKQALSNDPEVRAVFLAAKWAQRIGLPPGNLWEPSIARAVMRTYERLGNWDEVEAEYEVQLGLEEG